MEWFKRGVVAQTSNHWWGGCLCFLPPHFSDPVPASQVDGLVVHHEEDHPPRVVDQGPPACHPRYPPPLSAAATAAAAPPADAASPRVHRLEEAGVISLDHARGDKSFRWERLQYCVLEASERGAVLIRGVISAYLGKQNTGGGLLYYLVGLEEACCRWGGGGGDVPVCHWLFGHFFAILLPIQDTRCSISPTYTSPCSSSSARAIQDMI